MVVGRILMGGSGSTGSSLLKNILNRHPNIYSGTESALLSKHELYQDWESARNRLFKKKFQGLANYGWHHLRGVHLPQAEYNASKSQILQLAQSTPNFQTFCDQLFTQAAGRQDDFMWLEKTPSNAACFSLFNEHFDQAFLIHMTRNPLDTIASLTERGYSTYYATSIYLLNSASALRESSKPNYHQVRYEDLVLSPEESIKKILTFLDVPIDQNIIYSHGEEVPESQLAGWHYDETANIGQEGIGRFHKLNDVKKDEILSAINYISISKSGRKYYGLDLTSVHDVAEILGYSGIPTESNPIYWKLEKVKDRLGRLIRGLPTGVHYPIDVR